MDLIQIYKSESMDLRIRWIPASLGYKSSHPIAHSKWINHNMAPIPNQNSVSSAIIIAVIVGGGIVILSILPILLTGIYLYLDDIWSIMIKNRKNYLEWNRLRKEWNKIAVMESRRRFIMTLLLAQEVDKRGLSEEDRFCYAGMVSVL
jgi:hypothetical protein